MRCRVLIVDDEVFQQKVIEQIVKSKLGFETLLASSGEEALDILLKGEERIDLVLLDISMPGMNGVELLKKIKPLRPDLPVIMVTIHSDISLAVESIKAGAADYVTKDTIYERLKLSIQNAMKMHVLADEVARLRRKSEGQVQFGDIIGISRPIHDAKIIAERAALSEIPVFIEGEGGVGKALFANAIHSCSKYSNKPFVSVNFGKTIEGMDTSYNALIKEIKSKMEELKKSVGGGTLYLDGVDAIEPGVQNLLLGELEGDLNSTRVIASSYDKLEPLVRDNKYNPRLYSKLKKFPISIPPLRSRKEDISPLVESFCKKFSASEGKNISGFTTGAIDVLTSHSWPGNVKELRNAVFKAVLLCENELIDSKDFSKLSSKISSNSMAYNNLGKQFQLCDPNGDYRTLLDIEKEVIIGALEHYKWHISHVARKLGIGRSTLYRKMTEFNIKAPIVGHQVA